MSSLTVQNNVTNQYINSVKSDKCNFISLIAKVSLVVFPLILLVTFLIDLFSKSNSNSSGPSLKQEVMDLIADQNDQPAEKVTKLFDIVQNRTGEDILSTANEMVQDAPTFKKVMVAIAAIKGSVEDPSFLIDHIERTYPELVNTVKMLSSNGEEA